MKAFNYVGNTWLLAHLIHPFIFYFFFLFILNDPLDLGAMVSLTTASLILSLPALIVAVLLIRVVPRVRVPVTANLFIWLLLATASIIVNVALVGLLLGEQSLFIEGWTFYFPALIATTVSVLIRYKHFCQYLLHHHTQTNDYENNLV